MLIINADDFGASESVNAAIVEAFRQGLCSSTTIMPNMPYTEAAAELAHENNLLDHVGLHMVLTEGFPLTEGIRHCPRFCNEKEEFCLTRKQRVFHLSREEKTAVTDEIRAQIKRCRDLGLPLTHMDSHSHAHEEWGIASVVMALARDEGIPHVRLAINCGLVMRWPARGYRFLLNSRLRHAGLARVRRFGMIDEYPSCAKTAIPKKRGESLELMTHPDCDGRGGLVDALAQVPLKELVARIPSAGSAVSFAGTRYHAQAEEARATE